MIDYLPESCTYDTLYAKIIFQIKKTKLQHIVASYKRIKFSYIGRRL